MASNNSSSFLTWEERRELIWRNGESPDISVGVFVGATVYMVLIGTFGITANCATLVAFFRHKTLRTPFNLVLINLILTDLIVAAYGIPVDAVAAALLGWKLGYGCCIATGFILMISGMASIYTLMALSVQRFLLVAYPTTTSFATIKASKLVLLSIWTLAFMIAGPPLFGWSEYVPESSGLSCAPAWEDPGQAAYAWYIIVVGFFFPLTVILVSSGCVIHAMRQHSQRSLGISNKNADRERQVNFMVRLMVAAFIVSWTPYAAVCFLRMLHVPISPTIVAFPMLFAKGSCCWNPIIYVMLNNHFRDAVLPNFLLRLFKVTGEEVEGKIGMTDVSTKNQHQTTSRKTHIYIDEKKQCHQDSQKIVMGKKHTVDLTDKSTHI